MSKLHLDPPLRAPEQKWFADVYNRIKVGPFMIKGYTVSNLPAAAEWSDNATFSSLIFVSNEAGGATLAFSDGSSWRRVQDRNVVS